MTYFDTYESFLECLISDNCKLQHMRKVADCNPGNPITNTVRDSLARNPLMTVLDDTSLNAKKSKDTR